MRIRPAYQNVLGRATFELNATGDGSGVSTLRMRASANTTLTLVGDANFYTNSGGTEGESKTRTVGTSMTIIYLKCTGTARLVIPEQRLITQMGDVSNPGWVSGTNAASISSAGFPLRNLTSLNIAGSGSFAGKLPDLLTTAILNNTLLYWTLPSSLPAGLTTLVIIGNNVIYSSISTLPTGLTALRLESNAINWTGFDVSGTGNMTFFSLANFVTTAMTVTQLIALLSSMAGRSGNLPATCTISDYSNSPTAATIAAATSDVNGTDAEKAKYWIDQIFANKATTTIALQGTNITKP